MMVYGVHFGCVFEGGGIRAIFSTYENAEEYATVLVKRETLMGREYDCERNWERCADKDGWTDGSDEVVIISFNVDESDIETLLNENLLRELRIIAASTPRAQP